MIAWTSSAQALDSLYFFRLERLVGIAVSAQIVSHHAEFLGKITLDLALP
jgi:hypothetical protein